MKSNFSPSEVKSDNQIIAEFMGLEIGEIGYWGTDTETQWQRDHRDWIEESGIEAVGKYAVDFKTGDWLDWDDISYDGSWDWLMPVVIKCEDLVDKMEREFPEAKDLDDPTGWKAWSYRRPSLVTDIQKTYSQVVQFIKWYNSQNQ